MEPSKPPDEGRRKSILWVLRGALLAAPFLAAAWYRTGVEAAGTRWGWFAALSGFLMAVCLFAAAWMWLGRAQPGPSPAEPAPLRAWQRWALVLGVGLAFCGSAARYLEYFPASVEGEAADALDSAQSWVEHREKGKFWWAVSHRVRGYNLGLTPVVYPVVAAYGPHPLAYKWTNTVYFALILGLLAVVFAQLNLPPGGRWVVVLLPLLSILLPSLQMYRWHCVCLAGALALIAAAGARSRGGFLAGLTLYGLLLTLYHGQMIYQAGLLGLAAWSVWQPEDGRRRWDRVAALVGCAVLGWIIYDLQNPISIFDPRNRGMVEAAKWPSLLEGQRLEIVARLVLLAPDVLLSWPVWGLLLLGFAATCERAERHPADRMALLLGFAGLGLHAIAQPIQNASCRCWYLLPALWIFLNGLGGVAEWLRRACGERLGTALAVLGLGWVGLVEIPNYLVKKLAFTLDSPPAQWNTSHQCDYLFRHLARLSPANPPALHVLPGGGIPVTSGNFIRGLAHVQSDWRRAGVEIRVYESEAELGRLLQGVLEGRLRHRRMVLYLSQLGDNHPWAPESVQPLLRGVPYRWRQLELQGPPLLRPMRCYEITVEAREAAR